MKTGPRPPPLTPAPRSRAAVPVASAANPGITALPVAAADNIETTLTSKPRPERIKPACTL